VELQARGLVFRDRANGGVITYVPGLARFDDGVLARGTRSSARASKSPTMASRWTYE
jgi:hypothetical protein